LAVFFNGLLSPGDSEEWGAAQKILLKADPQLAQEWTSLRRQLDIQDLGFLRAMVTAQREPIAQTILRGLTRGIDQYQGARGTKSGLRSLKSRIAQTLARICEQGEPSPTPTNIRDLFNELLEIAPVILLIDEFGKNLEALSTSPPGSDLFLLQLLAERAMQYGGNPFCIITMQHLGFDEYLSSTSEAARREWVKVQGRFEDFAYTGNGLQMRSLIASAFLPVSGDEFGRALSEWGQQFFEKAGETGTDILLLSPELVAGCYPLHPISQLVLPELCTRYGQNERTAFSFLSSQEEASAGRFMSTSSWAPGEELPCVKLDLVYDYFVRSAVPSSTVSTTASRWIEISTIIRDASNLSALELGVIKTIALLNLVSAGGTLRASKGIISLALGDHPSQGAASSKVSSILGQLTKKGLLTYREFSDEYRIWHGSDLDIRGLLGSTKQRFSTITTERILNAAIPLCPVVAARHSQKSNLIRAFERAWFDPSTDPFSTSSDLDGLLLMMPVRKPWPELAKLSARDRPIALTRPRGSKDTLREPALEVATLGELLRDSERLKLDWVVHRELLERHAEAFHALEEAIEHTYGRVSEAEWLAVFPSGESKILGNSALGSSYLSDIADQTYWASPHIANEMINRRVLTSQGAQARRLLLDRMITHSTEANLGIVGFGPERAIYEAVLLAPGIHGLRGSQWGFGAPSSGSDFRHAWAVLEKVLKSSSSLKIGLVTALDQLSAPPLGIREGVAPILVAAILLARSNDVALYEHGSFCAAISPDLLERAIKNPAYYEIKLFQSRRGARKELLAGLSELFHIESEQTSESGALLPVVTEIMRRVGKLPYYTIHTKQISISALGVRDAALIAKEPDVFLFKDLPQALGYPAITGLPPNPTATIAKYANDLFVALTELESVYPCLLSQIEKRIGSALGVGRKILRKTLVSRAVELELKAPDNRLKPLLAALLSDRLGSREWIEYIAMTIHGQPPSRWTDGDMQQFEIKLSEISSTFRRFEALASAGMDSCQERVVVSYAGSNGSETSKVIWLTPDAKQVLGPLVVDLLRRAGQIVNSEVEETEEVVLAVLIEEIGKRLERTSDHQEDE
jgi:hypothetical protein